MIIIIGISICISICICIALGGADIPKNRNDIGNIQINKKRK